MLERLLRKFDQTRPLASNLVLEAKAAHNLTHYFVLSLAEMRGGGLGSMGAWELR